MDIKEREREIIIMMKDMISDDDYSDDDLLDAYYDAVCDAAYDEGYEISYDERERLLEISDFLGDINYDTYL